MRLALQYGTTPRRMALGAAAAVLSWLRHDPAPGAAADLDEGRLATLLSQCWGVHADEQAAKLVGLTWQALAQLREGIL